jgi:cytochrome P450
MSGVDFDHTHPEHGINLLERYEKLRRLCPVAWSEHHGGYWIVSRYREVVEALQDHRTFSSRQITIPPLPAPVPSLPTESDPPEHSDYRRILWPFLQPAAVKQYEGFVREAVTNAIDEFIEWGEAEIVRPWPMWFPTRW